MTTHPQNWLGLPDRFPSPTSQFVVPRLEDGSAAPLLRTLMTSPGDAPAAMRSDIRLWWTGTALRLNARLFTGNLDRVRRLIETQTRYDRGQWGNDALEVQIDVGRSRREYAHFILAPTGQIEVYRGFSNRHVQGYHPKITLDITVDPLLGCWRLDATFPFAELGDAPVAGDEWGFNLMRVDPDETIGYSQWAPTYSDALCPEHFGTLIFAGPGESIATVSEPAAEVDAYVAHHAARRKFMREHINTTTLAQVQAQISVLAPDEPSAEAWNDWAIHLGGAGRPQPIRWEETTANQVSCLVPEHDHAVTLELAKIALPMVESWDLSAPTSAAVLTTRIETLADAFFITGDPRYAKAVAKAILVHEAFYQRVVSRPPSPRGHEFRELYDDFQVIQAVMLAYAYIGIAKAGFATPQVHQAAMSRFLRAGRIAAYNIEIAYHYGNHQIFESAGLAIIAALFPEFRQSNHWAAVASRSIQYHLSREVYPDGGYMERVGYHNVALTYTAQALCVINSSSQQHRFPEITSPEFLAIVDNMYRWALTMTLPDGAFPAFADYRYHSMLRMLTQGAVLRGLPELLLPAMKIAPQIVPRELRNLSIPDPPRSVTHLDTQFTMMRSDWDKKACHMAVEHGPLGGEHSHPDTMGFVAYAYGQPIALDAGMNVSYSDKLHASWYRTPAAHNIVTVDTAVSEKVAHRTHWHSGPHADILVMKSDAWRFSRGVAHERAILFARMGVWTIFDRLEWVDRDKPRPQYFDLHLHSPIMIQSQQPGRIEGVTGDPNVGLIIATSPLLDPSIELKSSAIPVPDSTGPQLRLHDAMQFYGTRLTALIPSITWRQPPDSGGGASFITLLIPYENSRPELKITWHAPEAVELEIAGTQLLFAHRQSGNQPTTKAGITFAGRSIVCINRPGVGIALEEIQ